MLTIKKAGLISSYLQWVESIKQEKGYGNEKRVNKKESKRIFFENDGAWSG
jgi:hypothetical protein